MGIDPTTHKPKTDHTTGSSTSQYTKDSANLSHKAQWESARLEAEARIVRESNKLKVQRQLEFESSKPKPPARLFLNKITLIQPSLPPCLDILKAWQSSWSKPTTTTTKEDSNNNNNNNKMHTMYAMMLSNDDLESPTSTLNFPGTTLLPLPLSVPLQVSAPMTNNNIELFNQSLLPLTNNTNDDDEIWKQFNLTKHNTEADQDHVNNNIMLNFQQDDDIMASVEAFRASDGFDNNINTPPISTNVLQVLEGGDQENLDGSMMCNVNLEENKHYWNSIFGLINESNDMNIVL